MKKMIIAVFLLTFFSACNSTPDAKEATAKSEEQSQNLKDGVAKTLEERASSCVCTKIFLPVCGENKQTYPNSCEADCAGVKYSMGACGELQ